METLRYRRAPSPAVMALWREGELLAPLLRSRDVHGLPLDVHLREGDCVDVYCGGTSLLRVSRASGGVRVQAHSSYREQTCAVMLMRRWALGEAGFGDALEQYLEGVAVGSRWTTREGAIQARWSRVREPWVPFDREAVLGYGTTARVRSFAAVDAARAELTELQAKERWQAVRPPKAGAEVDQLAVDPEGRLVLIELKDASHSNASVYYVPLQLLQYVWEWVEALEVIRPGLNELLQARVELGLTPRNVPAITGGVRAVLGFGDETSTPEVQRRMELVRAIVDGHLPPGVAPFELWTMSGDGLVLRTNG